VTPIGKQSARGPNAASAPKTVLNHRTLRDGTRAIRVALRRCALLAPFAPLYTLATMGERTRPARAPHSAQRTHGIAMRAVFAVCCFAVPLGASTAQEATEQQNNAPVPATAPQAEIVPEIPFAQQFEGVIEPIDPDSATIDPIVPGDAVDLDSFDPPIEVPPPPPPEPRGGTVIRSMGTGVASYYGRRFHGRLTANGERFNMNAMTAAHKTLPFGTRVRVTNPRNGRTVTVRINDRGPFIRGREIDLSRGAAERIGMISSGHARVRLDIVR